MQNKIRMKRNQIEMENSSTRYDFNKGVAQARHDRSPHTKLNAHAVMYNRNHNKYYRNTKSPMNPIVESIQR